MAKLLENLIPTFFLCAYLCLLLSGVEGSIGNDRWRPLFAFGDSYADTGNINISSHGPWYKPYGITYPGKPAGRFSDGFVLTDFIATEYLGSKLSPNPYRTRRKFPERCKHYGVNFAVGGTGVFDTTKHPNLTTQVDYFQKMLSGEDVDVHIDGNLTNSVAFVSIAGNDYYMFIKSGAPNEDLLSFIKGVVNNLALNLKRLLGMGFRTILVSGLQPLGCIPAITASSSFKECNDTYNKAVGYHNSLLQEKVDKLNNESQKHYHTTKPQIHILDLYDAFFTAFNATEPISGGLIFKNALKPCCLGKNATSGFAMVDKDGTELYTLCDDRSTAFFWDTFHPTHAGWGFMFPILNATLNQALY